MKKQINSTINAHLVRGAFYLLLLVAVCAIPFALAQRNTSKRSNVRGVPRLPQRSLAAGLSHAYGITSQVAKPRALHVPVLAPRQPSGACPATITQSTSQSIVDGNSVARSEERRVGKECRSRW